MSLFTELKRRNVFRVGIAYGVVAWFIIQAADIMLANFGAPGWVFKSVVGLLALGFPLALFLSWAYELTPEGVKKSADVAPAESATPRTGRRIDRVILVGALAVIAVMGVERVWFAGRGADGAPGSVASEAGVQMQPAVEKSVAVLPFADLSRTGDQAWFVDGLTEEILNSLARLPELKVSARTSSFRFRQTDRDIRAIAEALDVANVVEGSVRRIDEQLRVTVQLIRAADGFHLWSETYDRTTDDLFDVQRDVAEKIAVTLDVFLDSTTRERMFATGTRNVEAFQAFLQGQDLLMRVHADEPGISLWDANEHLERALALDPGYVAAALSHQDAFAHYLMDGPSSGFLGDSDGRSPATEQEALRRLMADIDRAIENAPTPATQATAQLIKVFFSSDWTRMPGLLAQLESESAIAEASNVEIWLANILAINGDAGLRRMLSDYEMETNPFGAGPWSNRVSLEISKGEFEKAELAIKRGRQHVGDHPWLRDDELHLAIARRDQDAVLALLPAPDDEPRERDWRAAYYHAVQGDYDTALQIAEEIDSTDTWPEERLLLVYHETGDRDRARDLVARIDALTAGPVILARAVSVMANMLFFDLADAPNFAARLAEAEIDPASFRPMPRLSAPAD